MIFCTKIAGLDCMVSYRYKVTAEAYPGCGPSYASGGEPPSPMEFEITIDHLASDPDVKPLELPDWLREALTDLMQEDARVYDEISEDHAYRKYGDPDEARERARDESRDI